MNIGDVARSTGLPAKTIRYYEHIDLVTPSRAENGYREYGSDDVHRLSFIQRARSLGFSIDECRLLLSLYNDKKRASSDVKNLALAKIEEVDRKIGELRALRSTLKTLADTCHGNERPDCPILDEMAGGVPE
jgi:MerR family transcriptional regulator, copper efflux regulator